jgi:hypothetical protein
MPQVVELVVEVVVDAGELPKAEVLGMPMVGTTKGYLLHLAEFV